MMKLKKLESLKLQWTLHHDGFRCKNIEDHIILRISLELVPSLNLMKEEDLRDEERKVSIKMKKILDKYSEKHLILRGNKLEKNMVKTIKDANQTKEDVISYMETKYPKMTSEFRIQREQYELFLRKQHDYEPQKYYCVGTTLINDEDKRLVLDGYLV